MYINRNRGIIKKVPVQKSASAFCVCVLSHIGLLATLCTVAHQASLSMGFPRQEHWSRLPFPPPGDIPYPGIKPTFPAVAGGFFTTEPLEAQSMCLSRHKYV